MPAYVLSMRDQKISGLNYARLKTGEVAQTGLSFKSEDNQITKEDHYLNSLKSRMLNS